MITPTSSASLAGRALRHGGAAAPGLTRLTLCVEASGWPTPAPAPQARRLASALEACFSDGAAVPVSARAAAARAFAAGSGFLPGQLIDRAI